LNLGLESPAHVFEHTSSEVTVVNLNWGHLDLVNLFYGVLFLTRDLYDFLIDSN
jgi:hypothetical protein